MTFPRSPKVVYAPETEHRARLRKAQVTTAYSLTPGKPTPGLLLATDLRPADARETAARGEGEHGEVRVEGEGEHGADHVEVGGKGQDAGGQLRADEFVPEPGAALGSLKKPPLAVYSDAMDKMKDWLRKQRLTKAIAYFVESEVDLESMLELTEKQFEEWLSELPLDTLQKVRLRKGVAKLRVEPKTESLESDEKSADESKDAIDLAKADERADDETQPLKESTPDIASLFIEPSLAKATKTDFRFDPFVLKKGLMDPKKYRFSADRKTATQIWKGGVFPFTLLTPALERGKHELNFFVEKTKKVSFVHVGVWNAHVSDNFELGFFGNGAVFKVGDLIVEQTEVPNAAFGGWRQGDHVKIIFDLDHNSVSVHSAFGAFTVAYKPTEIPMRIAFLMSRNATATIV